MFKRKNPRSTIGHVREMVWPSMGWLRALRYAGHRVVRLSDTTHKIAGGLALGTAVSFSPLIGTHFIQAAILCFIFRFNILAAFIGTAAGNPGTFPFIWWAGYKLGMLVFGFFGWHGAEALPDPVTFSVMWDIARTKPLEIFLPWMLGGYLIGFFVWFPAYFIYYPLVGGARAARQKLREARIHKAAREVTGQKK